MKLPDFLTKGAKQGDELFIAFLIGKNWIQGGLWEVKEGKAEIVANGTTDSWQDTESFIQAADDSLSAAFGRLESPHEDPKTVVFGLTSSWIENGNVTPEKLRELKTLCEKLEITPAGFVVIPEAIIHFLKSKEGAPTSCILVGINEQDLEVVLVKGGKLTSQQTVSRSISLADDITEGLSRFGTKEPLPARIVLYDRQTNELEEATQQLISWEWPTTFFLHTPRIEFLSANDVLLAVSSAAAAEFGGQKTEIVEEEQTQESAPRSQQFEEGEKEPEEKEELEEKGEKPAEKNVTTEETDDNEKLTVIASQASEFGFQEGNVAPSERSRVIPPSQVSGIQQKESTYRGFLSKFHPSFSLPRMGGGRARWVITALFAIFTVLGLVLWFVPHAVVTVFVAPREIEENLTITVDSTGREGQGVLPARIAGVKVSGEKTRQTTGNKTVGDRAKGEVKILNNTSQARTFATGTLLAGPNGLKFTLDSEVVVASESGAPDYTPGEAKATVTAADIGAEYNLASGSLFSLANFSTSAFSAKNEGAFAGGSSREVSAVAKVDKEKLEDELAQELREKAKSQVIGEVREGETVVAESTKVAITKRSFSNDVGEETQTLKLTLEAEGSVVVVSKEKLNDALRAALEGKVPEGFSLKEEQISAQFRDVVEGDEEKEGKRQFEVHAVAHLLPSLDNGKLARVISWKSPAEVREKLTVIPGFTRTSIKVSPSVPILASRLPLQAGNITIKLLPEP
ncbi:hypothetical protein HY405_01040 [Candidatus Microgenomates bacterium]|nr:hypothetical protein [Candidatus Microgenomates bacterium]